MADNGWIKIYRSIRSNWVWEDYEMTHYWIDILLMVNHTESKVPVGKKLITVKPGQRMTSLRKLSVRWDISKDKVKRVLEMFENDGMITVKLENNATLITVVNYWLYQVSDGKRRDTDKDTFKDTNKDTNKDTYKDTSKDTFKDTNTTQTRMTKNDIKNVNKNDIRTKENAPLVDSFGQEIEE